MCSCLACNDRAEDATEDARTELDPAVVVVVAVMAIVTVVTMARCHRTRRQMVHRMDVARRGMMRWHRTGNRLVRRGFRHRLRDDVVLHRLGHGLRHRFRDLDHRRLALGHRAIVVRRRRESRAAQRNTGDTGHHHFLNHVVHITPTFLRFMR